MNRVRGAALAIALMLAACSATGDRSTTPTTPASTSIDPGTEPSPRPDGVERPAGTIAWEDCGRGFECGTLEVPLDYDDPDGQTIELAVTRHPAEDPARRLGALLVNPGGPGASAVDLARQFPRAGAIGDRFDIVGFDPRGVGGSTPLDCNTHLINLFDADPTVDSEADRQEHLLVSQQFVDECEGKYFEMLPFLGTTDVARDMDEVRRALGEEQINYLGYSYGTSLGQEYARLFPARVRSMILDGVVDHAPNGIDTARAQAAGFATAYENYLAFCTGDDCGLPVDVATAVNEVMAAAEQAPIPAPNADRPATPGVVSLGITQALYSEQLWSTLSRALRDALDGDGSGLVELANTYLGVESDGSIDSSFEVYFAVSCLDDTWPSDPNEVIDASIAAADVDPLFGPAVVIDYLRCSIWPAESKALSVVPADLEGLVPVLVVSTTGDPATPYENGVRVADQIPGAVLLTNEGEGHTIVALGKPCIDDIATAYLVDLELPDDGTTCA